MVPFARTSTVGPTMASRGTRRPTRWEARPSGCITPASLQHSEQVFIHSKHEPSTVTAARNVSPFGTAWHSVTVLFELDFPIFKKLYFTKILFNGAVAF